MHKLIILTFIGRATASVGVLLSTIPTPSFGQESMEQLVNVGEQQIRKCGGVILKAVERPGIIAQAAPELFTIVPEFDPNVTAAQRNVIQQAINEWDALIDSSGFNPGDYPITFRYGLLSSGALALTTTTFVVNTGNLVSAAVVFNNDGSFTWFEDPTPADDSEFQATLPPGFDLLSVARHEIGHALGWTSTARVASLMSGDTFDPALLNIATAPGDTSHTAPSIHVDDIMNPSIGAGTRRPISFYPAVAMLSQSFNYWISQLRCLALTSPGNQTGSVYQPWTNVLRAFIFAPKDAVLLIEPGTYTENSSSEPLTRSLAMTLMAIRGGSVTITRPE